MKYIFMLILSIFIIGCAEKPKPLIVEKIEQSDFMSQMISQYSLNDAKLQKIQFYISHDIVLHKQNAKDSTSVSKGTLLVHTDSQSKEILIKAGTPCLFIEGNEQYITVLFDNNIRLKFVNPYQKCCAKSSRYYLAANHWIDNIGTLNIAGSCYKALGVSGQSYLKIDKKSLMNNRRNSLVLKGKKVS